MSDSETLKKDACWEVFKAKKAVACLKRQIEQHMVASSEVVAAWRDETLYGLANGMIQAKAAGPAITGLLGDQLNSKLLDYQEAQRALAEKQKAFQELLS